MRLLLDTHAFMWWDSDPDKILEETFTLLKQPKNELLLSLVSAITKILLIGYSLPKAVLNQFRS